MKHGTRRRYDAGCRCDECRAFKSAKDKRRRGRLRALVASGDPSIRHGEASTYSKGSCRCGPCKDAYSAVSREVRTAHPEWNSAAWRAANPDRHAQYEREQDVLAGTATNGGKMWTGAELDVVTSRTDLSVTELAGLLGRTRAAVDAARHRATRDPKWVQVAGLSRQERDA